MARPTSVTVLDYNRLYVEVNPTELPDRFLQLGFVRSTNYEHVYWFERKNSEEIYAMCDKMRDIGVPFKTHRHGGADYALEALRKKGHVSGKFIRINYFDNDFAEDAPYKLEEF